MNSRERHEVFKAQCHKGHKWQNWVAHFLRVRGLPATAPKEAVVSSNPTLSRFKDNKGDVLVGGLPPEGVRVEVKSAKYYFTSPSGFPTEREAGRNEPMVDSVSCYEAKVQSGMAPDVYVVVSKHTGAMIWVSVAETRDKWFEVERWDDSLKRMDRFYQCHRREWGTIDGLVGRLRGYLGLPRED